MNLKLFKEVVINKKKKEPVVKDSLIAFFSGGILGVIGQGLIDFNKNYLYLNDDEASAFMSIIVIFIASLLTLFGVYKKLGKVCGSGLFLPTTGFSNSIVSASMEGRHEGFVLGVGSQIFALAGSVITYGVSSAVILLIIRFFLVLIGVNL